MRKMTYMDIKEYLDLFWINLVVKKRNFVDFLKVVGKYYPTFSFFKKDMSLLLTYLFDNPFAISKRFLIKKGEKDVYAYGETPLTTLDFIAKECRLSSDDTVFELGCGRGRSCFWLNQFIGCKVVGVEIIPDFIERAERVKRKLKVQNIEFRNEDMLNTDFKGATVLYLYGTCLEEEFIKRLINRFKSLPTGTKIITVSYSLPEFTHEPVFEIMKRFPAKFTWGTADVYLQIKK